MTVSTEVSREEYSGNGVTTDFDYRFRVFTAENLRVEVADIQGQIAALTLNADFTVTGAGSRAGGKVRLKKPLGKDWRISISRHLPITQETDLRNQGNFFPEVHEDVFDKLTMLIQQVFGKFGLELRKPSWLANYFDARQQRIAHLALPVDEQDVATKGYADTLDAKTNRHVEELDAKTNQHVEALNSATNTRVTELDKATNERVGQLHADISNRALRTPEGAIAPIPPVALRAGKLLSFDALGAPIAALPPTGSAADVLTELAKADGATKIGSQQPDGESETVQQALTNIRKEADKKFDKTGGIVNGDVIVEGSLTLMKGDDRKHFCIQNQDGRARMWLYKDKGGDGVHLNNGEDGGGDWLFHKNGNFHAPAGIVAGGNVTVSWGGRTATFHENGDVAGPLWGGPLSAWLHNQLNSRGTKNTAQKAQDGWWQCGDTGVIEQWGRAKIEGDYGVIRFPREFTSGCLNVVIIPEDSNTRASVGERGRTSFNVSTPMSVSGKFFLWRAIGA